MKQINLDLSFHDKGQAGLTTLKPVVAWYDIPYLYGNVAIQDGDVTDRLLFLGTLSKPVEIAGNVAAITYKGHYTNDKGITYLPSIAVVTLDRAQNLAGFLITEAASGKIIHQDAMQTPSKVTVKF